MTNATFTAWQILAHEGKVKKGWSKYLKKMVPTLTKKEKVSKKEKLNLFAEAIETDKILKAYEKYLKRKG